MRDFQYRTRSFRERSSTGCAALSATRFGHWKSCRSHEQVMERMRTPKARSFKLGLWAAHLDPELGGQGFGQLKLGLMHEIIGAFAHPRVAPRLFGNQVGGSTRQPEIPRDRRHQGPKTDGSSRSTGSALRLCDDCRPEVAGSDPTQSQTTAWRDGETTRTVTYLFASNGGI